MAARRADGLSAGLSAPLGATLGVIRLLRAEMSPQCGHTTLPSANLCVTGGAVAEPGLELMFVPANEPVDDHIPHIVL